MSAPTLKIDWCTHAAAKYAVEHWHYSKRMPMPPFVRVGAWEDGVYIGCVIFSRGARPEIGKRYGCSETEACELTRIALREHATPVSRVLSIALKFLRRSSPGLRLIVSFADPAEGHHGGIYQACGWTYVGDTEKSRLWFYGGRWTHTRELTGGAFGGPRKRKEGTAGLPSKDMPGKHRYLLPLDPAMRAQIAPLAKPYPKRASSPGAGNGSPVGTPGGEGGAKPTPALQGRSK